MSPSKWRQTSLAGVPYVHFMSHWLRRHTQTFPPSVCRRPGGGVGGPRCQLGPRVSYDIWDRGVWRQAAACAGGWRGPVGARQCSKVIQTGKHSLLLSMIHQLFCRSCLLRPGVSAVLPVNVEAFGSFRIAVLKQAQDWNETPRLLNIMAFTYLCSFRVFESKRDTQNTMHVSNLSRTLTGHRIGLWKNFKILMMAVIIQNCLNKKSICILVVEIFESSGFKTNFSN